MVRRLPVLQTPSPEDEAAEQRPRSHWVAITAGMVMSLWVPLTVAGYALGRRAAAAILGAADPSELALAASGASLARARWATVVLVAPVVIAFVLACVVAGAVTGRFGGRSGAREAVSGAVLAALVAWLLPVVGGTLRPWSVALATLAVLLGLAAFFAAVGGRLGFRRRSPS